MGQDHDVGLGDGGFGCMALCWGPGKPVLVSGLTHVCCHPPSGRAAGLAALPPEEVGAAGSAAAGAAEEAASGGWRGDSGWRSGPRCPLQRAEQLPAQDSAQHPGLALADCAGTGEGTCHGGQPRA